MRKRKIEKLVQEIIKRLPIGEKPIKVFEKEPTCPYCKSNMTIKIFTDAPHRGYYHCDYCGHFGGLVILDGYNNRKLH